MLLFLNIKTNILTFILMILCLITGQFSITGQTTSNQINNTQHTIDSLENILKTANKKEKPAILNEPAKNYMKISLEKSIEYADMALKQDNKKQQAMALKNLGVSNYYKSNFDTSLEYYNNALEIFEQLNDKKGIAQMHNNIGVIYDDWCEYEKAMEYYKNSFEIFKETGDKLGIAQTTNNIGLIYQKWSNYEKAIEYYQKSLKKYTELGNKPGIAIVNNNIGLIYQKWGNYEKAIEFYQKSLETEEELNNKIGIAISLNNLGMIYKIWGKYEKAMKYYKSSLILSEEINNKQGVAYSIHNIGNIYFYQNNHAKVLEYENRALELYKELNNIKGKAMVLSILGSSFKHSGSYDKATEYFNESLQIAKLINDKELIYENYLDLSEINSAVGNHKKAMEYYKLYTVVKDSVFNEESSKKIAELEIRYETDKKDKQIKALEFENNLKTIKISHQKKLHTIYLIAFIFALIAITIILVQLRKKNIAYKFLVKKNLDLLSKEKKLKILKEEITLNKSNKDRKITITDNIKEKILEKLEQLLEREKIFKDFDLTIDKLAKNISTNRNYLSQTIYKEFVKNFNDFINEYRVKEAMLLLSDPQKSSKLSVAGIANESGFRSVSKFNLAFKKFTGITPSNFRAKTNTL